MDPVPFARPQSRANLLPMNSLAPVGADTKGPHYQEVIHEPQGFPHQNNFGLGSCMGWRPGSGCSAWALQRSGYCCTSNTVLAVVRQMRSQGKGIVGMKILGQGDLRYQQDRALHFALSTGALDAFTIGAENISEQNDLLRRIAAA
jgi:hypothetical protein